MILIIRIINTTCFDNTISMVELEGKLPSRSWSLFALTSTILVTFTRGLACTFRKVWSTSTLKNYCRHYILGFLVFFTGKQYMKTPMKVSIKVQRIVETLSRMQSRMSITFNFFGRRSSLFFFAEGWYHICNIYTYVIFPCISWERSSCIFLPKKKYHIFREKNTIFPDNTRKIIFQRDFFWKDYLFGAFEENIVFSCIFLRKTVFHFPSKE